MKKTERRTGRTSESAATLKATKATGRRQSGGGGRSSDPVVENLSGEHLGLTEIKELIELISEKQFNEFELERGDFRLRLHKGGLVQAEVSTPVQVVASAPPPASVAAEPLAAEKAIEENLHIITSPIVGTFYRSPSPTAESFVKAGDTVEIGRTMCIIEAMKLMNEIQSDALGVVAKIFVDNGQPVEYGQPLFGLKLQ